MKKIIDVINKYADFNTISSAIIVFALIMLASYGVPKISQNLFHPKDGVNETTSINVSTLTKETIEEAKSSATTLDFEYTFPILETPVQTPTFVSDPDRLRDYLGKKSVSINVSGIFKSAYLYVKPENLNIQGESVYFYMVDGVVAEGHLYPPDSLQPITDNVFIYDLEKLPLQKFPYSLADRSSVVYKNVVKDLFNAHPEKSKIYYAGAFVSTLKLPNQILSLEIRYKCDPSSKCSISRN